MLPIAAVVVALLGVIFLVLGAGDMEILSFVVSKLCLATFPTTFPQNSTADAQRWRQRLALGSALTIKTTPQVHSEDVFVSLENNDQGLLRIYNKRVGDSGPLKDVMIFFFPGAWILGGVQENDILCKYFAMHTNFVVVSVEYRLAPEFPFPSGFNDAVNALTWVRDNIHTYGGNSNQIFVTGESAGGNLAAAVVARNYDERIIGAEERVDIRGLLMIYPPLFRNFSTDSYVKYAKFNGMLTRAVMEHAWDIYSGGDRSLQQSRDYRYEPMYTPTDILRRFPPTEFIVAEYDVLRDDSIHFAERLREVGVPVGFRNYNATIHGFFGRDFSPSGDPAVKYASDRLLRLSQLSLSNR